MLTHERRTEVLRTVARMTEAPERPHVVVVDNGSRDGTSAAVAARFPTVDVVRLAENRGAAARNVGVRRAARPYVAFADDDTWWAPGALARAADVLDTHATLAVVTGRVLVGPEQREDDACAAMAASPLPPCPGLPGRSVLGFLAGASMVRGAAFLGAGGFHHRLFIGGEEELLALDLAAAGWTLAYVPDVVVHHLPSPRREVHHRRRVLARNALWCAWLRRPVPSAVRRTLAVVAAGARDPHRIRGCLDALAGAPWVARERRVVPPSVEQRLRLLDGWRCEPPRHRGSAFESLMGRRRFELRTR